MYISIEHFFRKRNFCPMKKFYITVKKVTIKATYKYFLILSNSLESSKSDLVKLSNNFF